MRKRPTSVTVICFILIALGAISLISSVINLNNPMARDLMGRSPIPIPVQHVIMFTGLLITLLSGILMLKGTNWARMLYVVWSVLAFGFGLATSPMKAALIPGVVVFAVMAFFLFRPKANEFFNPKEAGRGEENI